MKNFNSGITLIALIISIIVLLILAGVSINALVGENGIITQAMNASFLSEMTAVQESFDLWKTQHYDDDEIPTKGLVKSKDIEGNGRIYGEIAYYRRWSGNENKQKPEESITADLNSIYGGDITYMPNGVEDLYYLDNDGIGIKGDKKYIIDATNSIIYAVNGYTVNGVTVHSIPMYKAITSGVNEMPNFVVAEAKGSGSNIVNAGSKYYVDKDGNYVDAEGNPVSEPIENPYGFQILATNSSENIYKLYNNGDLYGKGIKGTGLNTSAEEMSSINPLSYAKMTIPGEIVGSETDLTWEQAISNNLTIISGDQCIFVLTSRR